jgi:hypothetical protein
MFPESRECLQVGGISRWPSCPSLDSQLQRQPQRRLQTLSLSIAHLSPRRPSPMTDKLPPQLLQLFAPRPALRYLPPCDYAPEERRTPAISGVAQYLQAAKDYNDDYVPTESWLQKKDRQKMERDEAAQYRVTDGYKNECAQPSPILHHLPRH